MMETTLRSLSYSCQRLRVSALEGRRLPELAGAWQLGLGHVVAKMQSANVRSIHLLKARGFQDQQPRARNLGELVAREE